MDKDQIAGSAKDFAGKVEGTVDGIAGDAVEMSISEQFTLVWRLKRE